VLDPSKKWVWQLNSYSVCYTSIEWASSRHTEFLWLGLLSEQTMGVC